MRVYFKVTTWESVEVPDELLNDVLSKIQNREIEDANELIEEVPEAVYEGIVMESSHQMSLEENDYYPTIEVYGRENKEKIFSNGVKR